MSKLDGLRCANCGKYYSRKKNLYEHIRNVHKQAVVLPGSLKCSVHECTFTCQRYSNLRTHMDKHGIKEKIVEKTFSTMEDFYKWKDELKRNHNIGYVLSSTHKSNEIKKFYYSCHRSGEPKKVNSRSKALKRLGSCKTGSTCPSTIQVTEKNGIVTALHNTIHVGHDLDAAHIRLSESVKDEIAGKLASGASKKTVLEEMRSVAVSQNKRVREHLLTVQDIKNVASAANLDHDERLHNDDATSVALWVENLKTFGANNPVVYFKPKGQTDSELSLEDFCLILISESQKSLLQKFPNDLFVDSTFNLSHNFHLSSLLVLDDHNSGFPVAFCISNRVDTPMMKLFFSFMKRKVGSVAANNFHSGDTPIFVDAWKSVMSHPMNYFLCYWHVVDDWQDACKIKGDKTMKDEIIRSAYALLKEPVENNFKKMLQDFLKNLFKCNSTLMFREYFKNKYATRCDLWASCYQDKSSIHLETLHRLITRIYQDGVKIKRLDKCISALIQLVENQWYERDLN